MRRSFLLVLWVALPALAFAALAAAQTDDRGMDDMDMNDRGMEDRGANDNMMATPTASASIMSTASASSMSSSSVSAKMVSATGGGKSKAASSGHLPHTGGMSLLPLLAIGALSLLVGAGIFAAGLVRRAS